MVDRYVALGLIAAVAVLVPVLREALATACLPETAEEPVVAAATPLDPEQRALARYLARRFYVAGPAGS